MDTNAFIDENFNAKNWINKVFKNLDPNENKNVFTHSLISKLQSNMHQINLSLEETSNQVLQSLPRIIHDTKLLQSEAEIIQKKMSNIKDKIAKVESDTGQSILDIEYLDQMKTKLELAKQGLHEADNWTVLANELEDIFETADIESISKKIFSMQQSLKILVNAPDFEDRKLSLEGLKNRLEAMASPLLVQAFTSGNIENSSGYVKIFKAIDRLPQLLKYYHKCQKGILVQHWRNILELEQDETFVHSMHNFYDYLLSNWHAQLKWCNQVFPTNNVLPTLVEIYADLLMNVDPSFNDCIDAALKQQSDKINFLFELKKITKQFASNIYSLIESSGQAKSCNSELLLSLSQAIYFPYIIYFKKYESYEEVQLLQQLNELNCINEDLSDTLQNLNMSVSRVFDIVSESNKRCQQLTESCCYNGLITALKTFFAAYLDIFKTTLRKIDKSKSSHEDWNMFQICLTLLQTSGNVLYQLQNFENELVTSIQDASKATYSIFTNYKILLLDDSGQQEYDKLIAKLTQNKPLLELVKVNFEKLCSDIHNMTYQVIFTPISIHLDSVQQAPAWSPNEKVVFLQPDLPDYSFTPQEYITQIGQYLMTLPQHLEPFLLQDNPSLTLALRSSDSVYLNSGTTNEDGGIADILLEIVARGTCQTYYDKILGICELKGSAHKQLAADIEYLGNVLDDLGLQLSENLQQISVLLRLSPEDYKKESAGCSARLVAAVRQMRNITSSG